MDHEEHPVGRKVFVEGLPHKRSQSIDDELLRLCKSLKIPGVIRLCQKRGYGFGYLLFKAEGQAATCIKKLNGQTFYDRVLRVELPKEMKRVNPASRLENVTWTRQVLLLGLPWAVNSEILQEVLADHLALELMQKVSHVKVMKYGKAFVTLRGPEDVPPFIVAVHGILNVMGSVVEAVKALPPDQTRGKPPPTAAEELTATKDDGPPLAPTQPYKRERVEVRATEEAEATEQLVTVGGKASKKTKLAEERLAALRPLLTPSSATPSNSLDVIIGGLAIDTTTSDLIEVLAERGAKVHKCSLIISRSTKLPSGMGKVTMRDTKSVEIALGLNGQNMHWGEMLRVEVPR